MRKREWAVCALLVLVGSAACSPDDEACERVAGVYQPLYLLQSGTCGDIRNPRMVDLEGGEGGVRTTTRNELGATVRTEVVHKGCQLSMSQQVMGVDGRVQSQINGMGLAVHSAERVSGQVNYVEFTADNQIACTGTYQATFTRPSTASGSIR